MKGCALRAVLQLALLVVAVAAVAGGLVALYQLRVSDVIGVSLLSGVLLWVAGSVLVAAIATSRERRTLGDSMAGRTPRDGERAILAGHLELKGKALQAPLSGRPCAAFTFEVWEMRGTGKSRSKAVHLDGLALTPTTVVTNAGSFRLLAVPEFDCDPTAVDHPTSVAHATDLWRRTPYIEPPRPFSGRPSIEDQWNDADGTFERIVRHTPEDVDLARCSFHEKTLESGDRVCVFGIYSEAQRAIVPNLQDWSQGARVMKGEPGDVLRQLSARVRRRLLVALLASGLAAGALAAFTNSLG